MDIQQYPYARSLTCDLAYTIFLNMGGTLMDIEQKYSSNLDDLLYAILKKGGASSTNINVPAGQNYYDLPAGTIIDFILCQTPTAVNNVSVGSALGNSDIYVAESENSGNYVLFDGKRIITANTRIYFNGIQPDTVISIYKK